MNRNGQSNSAATSLRSALAPALLILYPFIVHAAIIRGHDRVALLVFVAVLLLLILRNLLTALLVLLSVAAVLVLPSPIGADAWHHPLYLMPVMINCTLGVFFGRTLLPDRTPLITAISIHLRGRLEPGVAGYTRRVTQLWTAFFLVLVIESILLAAYAPIEIWSLFTNILNYVFAGLLFAGEYFFRIHHLDKLEHPGFLRFLRSLSRMNPGVFNGR